MPGEDFLSRWLPLILTGGSVAGSVVGSKVAAGASDRASEIGAQTAQKQLDAMLGMYGQNRADLAPYRAAGVNALANIQNWKPNDPNRKTSSVDFSKFQTPGGGGYGGGSDLPPSLARLTTGGGNALAGPTFGDIPTQGIHSRLGGVAKNALSGFGIGSTAAGVGKAVLGSALKVTPLGWAAGPAIGAVSGLFDNNNSDKNFATEGINRVGPWAWNTLMPAAQRGEITPDQAEQQLNESLRQWEESMRNTPNFNKDVLAKSVTSQRQYLAPFFDQLNQLRQRQPQAGVA